MQCQCKKWNSLTTRTCSSMELVYVLVKTIVMTHGTVRAPVFDRYQFFGTSEHYGKAHGNLLSGWMNYYCTACYWFPTSNNILILPSQFWQIRFESYWLHCSKCWILVLFNTVPVIVDRWNLSVTSRGFFDFFIRIFFNQPLLRYRQMFFH